MTNPDGSLAKKGSSSMANIIGHTENLRDDLVKKINIKMDHFSHPKSNSKLPNTKKIMHTNASELRARSVMAQQALEGIEYQIAQLKMNKGLYNDVSNLDIEKERHKLNKVTKLPPIMQMQQLDPIIDTMMNSGNTNSRNDLNPESTQVYGTKSVGKYDSSTAKKIKANRGSNISIQKSNFATIDVNHKASSKHFQTEQVSGLNANGPQPYDTLNFDNIDIDYDKKSMMNKYFQRKKSLA